jgi:putative endonuclease
MFFVYFIKSLNENYFYVGSSEDPTRRLREHNSGKVTSTKSRRPFELVYTEEYDKIDTARAREKQLKSSRSLKQKIIASLR